MAKNVYMQPRTKNRAAYIILLGPFFLGLILNIPAIDIYRDTFIPAMHTIVIYLVTGTLGLLCVLKVLNKESAGAGSKLFAGLIIIFSWGSIGNFIFMFANKQFAHTETIQQKITITSYDHWGTYHGSCDAPYVYAEINGLSKQFTYPCGTPVTRYKSITLVVSNGLFGYDVIRTKGLADLK